MGYRDPTYLILCADYSSILKLGKIIDSINQNGSGGHSFSVVLSQKDKNVITAGGFDGDGADSLNFIAIGSCENNINFDVFASSINVIDPFGDSNKGDTFLIARGTRCGCEAIAEIVTNILDLVKVSDEKCTVLTDDKPPVVCGMYTAPYVSMITTDSDCVFGFGFITDQEGNYSDPLAFFRENKCELIFFRGHIN